MKDTNNLKQEMMMEEAIASAELAGSTPPTTDWKEKYAEIIFRNWKNDDEVGLAVQTKELITDLARTIRDDLMGKKRIIEDETGDVLNEWEVVMVEDLQAYFKDRFNV